MATTTAHVPVEVYLHTAYEHDCDYINGEVLERPVGEMDHATWQGILVMFFGVRQKEWGIRVRPELRVQVAYKNYRVPDVCILSAERPVEQIVTHPPLAVFEILSPEDRLEKVLLRLEDFAQMGVPAIWLIDPTRNEYFTYSSGQLTPAKVFSLPGTDHQVNMAEIAAMLD